MDAQVTKGQRGTVFVLGPAMTGVWLLGLLVCCVGIIAAQPVVVVAGAFAYRVLSGQEVVPVPAAEASPAPPAPPAA